MIDRKARHQFLYPFVWMIQLFVNLSVVHTDIVIMNRHTYINIATSVTMSVTNQCYISYITMLPCSNITSEKKVKISIVARLLPVTDGFLVFLLPPIPQVDY
jgi:hypothetical protein